MSIIRDIKTELSSLAPKRSDILVFVLILVAISTFVSWRVYHFDGVIPLMLLMLGTILFLAASVRHTLLLPLYRLWMLLALILGWVMLRALLTVTFFLLITPLALIFRLTGKDPMRRAPASTYWLPVAKVEKERYYKKF
jgi:hypothetical protein